MLQLFSNGFYAVVGIAQGFINTPYTNWYFSFDWLSAFANWFGLVVLVQTLCLLIDLQSDLSILNSCATEESTYTQRTNLNEVSIEVEILQMSGRS